MNVYYWRTWYKAGCGGKGESEGQCAKGYYYHRAKQRLSAGRARDHPVMEIVPNKALSLSLLLLLLVVVVARRDLRGRDLSMF